jgi:hypothetical protein
MRCDLRRGISLASAFINLDVCCLFDCLPVSTLVSLPSTFSVFQTKIFSESVSHWISFSLFPLARSSLQNVSRSHPHLLLAHIYWHTPLSPAHHHTPTHTHSHSLTGHSDRDRESRRDARRPVGRAQARRLAARAAQRHCRTTVRL